MCQSLVVITTNLEAARRSLVADISPLLYSSHRVNSLVLVVRVWFLIRRACFPGDKSFN